MVKMANMSSLLGLCRVAKKATLPVILLTNYLL